MDILTKANIILEFTEEFKGEEDFIDFFEYHDLGVPLAISLVNDFITLTSKGQELVNETYKEICNIYQADENAEYESLDDLI